MCYIHKIETYLVLKKSEIPTHAKMWMNFEDFSELRQAQKDKYMVLFIWGLWYNKIHIDRKQNGGCQGLWAWGIENCLLMSIAFQFRKIKMFWKWMVVIFIFYFWWFQYLVSQGPKSEICFFFWHSLLPCFPICLVEIDCEPT